MGDSFCRGLLRGSPSINLTLKLGDNGINARYLNLILAHLQTGININQAFIKRITVLFGNR